MRNFAVVLLGGCVGLSGISSGSGQTPAPQASGTPAAMPSATADPKVYGQYPIAYKEVIGRWLETKLADPTSAVVDWSDAPKPGEYKTQKGDRYVGYVVDFKVNARNQFGAPTGKQRYRVVILNGEVVWGGHPRY